MKKQQKKYLALYEKWLETGKLPKGLGLCNEFGKFGGLGWSYDDDLFPLFVEGQDFAYWGYDVDFGKQDFLNNYEDQDKLADMRSSFTPLRQTILLFMAALNEEL